jgi:hypothetical protein
MPSAASSMRASHTLRRGGMRFDSVALIQHVFHIDVICILSTLACSSSSLPHLLPRGGMRLRPRVNLAPQ